MGCQQTPAEPPSPSLSMPVDPTSLARIEWVIGLDREPVRRNLLITQGYHDLSDALAGALGRENANWCTFASWASRTAGRFIREEEVPAAFRVLLGKLEPIHVSLARLNDALARVNTEASRDHDGILAIVRDTVRDVAEAIAAGNLAVFGELAPLFARALAVLAADEKPTALDTLVAELRPGPSERDGQTLLMSALRTYAVARAEADPRRKAAHMLFANGQVGLHEQIRLQRFIAGSINAPLRDALSAALEESGEGMPHPLAHEVHAVVSRMLHPIADATEALWQRFATRELMTLELPDGTLMLGRDVPAPPHAPLYPEVLDPIDDPAVSEFLGQYGADKPLAHDLDDRDWARLSYRMAYILELFRSRQCDAALFDEPLTREERAQAERATCTSG